MSNCLSVYTAILGGYDTLSEVEPQAGVEFVCFTDTASDIESDTWEIRRMSPAQYPVPKDPRRSSRWFKMFPHLTLRNDVSLWVDGSIDLRGDVLELRALLDPNCTMACFKHPVRTSIYDEAVKAARRHRGEDLRLCDEQAKAYRLMGMPDNTGLVAGGFLLRRRSLEQMRFNEAWWRLYLNGSTRDQLPLNYLVWMLNYPVQILPGNLHRSRWHVWSGRHG